MIRTLQDHGIHQGIDVHMECTVLTLLKDGDRVAGAVAYDRERGRFKTFAAKAIVLATGGVGRAFKITSNSWEYTGDGHSLAYHAGAALMDMEFVQFHPTGMIWPPSVRGILVTEGVRGEGGVLKNRDGKRFMFDSIPDNYKSSTADNPEEGWKYTQGDKNSRRPPELLTRDHVARMIVREVKEGRGSPHGGVFSTYRGSRRNFPTRPRTSRRSCRACTISSCSWRHRHHEDADGDRANDALHHGRDPRRWRHADVDGPWAFCLRRVRRGASWANRLGGNSLSDLLVFGQRAGEAAARFAKTQNMPQIAQRDGDEAERGALAPFDRSVAGEGPYQVQESLQATMQDLVGIVRKQSEMERALTEIETLKQRAAKVGVNGNREYNPGWHTALDLRHLLTVSEAISRGRRWRGRRVAADISATTIPTRATSSRNSTTSSARDRTARWFSSAPRSRPCLTLSRPSSRK